METSIRLNNKKVDIGNLMLNYNYYGVDDTSPTVILEAGYGMGSEVWGDLVSELSTIVNVLVYDRAGIGKSEAGTKPHHSKQVVENLKTLLQIEEIKPPYLLVGHSIGGIHIRQFAYTYPELVSGLILVDSAHEDQNDLMVPHFSDDVQEMYYGQFVVEGGLADFNSSLNQVRSARRPLKDLPVHVLSAGVKDDYHSEKTYQIWMRLQDDLLSLSNNTKQVIAKKSNHFIQNHEPKLIVNSVRDILDQIREEGANE
ncbi:alpha/beta fold hydrolase [Pseudalkalibacillus berkeleyi]|uniref:Alpha/beta hydrolase n=1 Tax=Pseudalkalibacillus berkeleyi TaxID=1069813 RepID=A0ABS9GUU3_9BACL|nr:alpha/beta hydrolase [Pseudalkalibacillus berkeleyi]MCF6136609.1 alpha/beta hydrolase [Pseudalkalibacillus berkeleyi]